MKISKNSFLEASPFFSLFLLFFFTGCLSLDDDNTPTLDPMTYEGADSLLLCHPQMNEPECLSIGTCCFIRVQMTKEDKKTTKTACILTSLTNRGSFDEYLGIILGEQINDAVKSFQGQTKKPFVMDLKCAFNKEDTLNKYKMTYYLPHQKLFYPTLCVGNNEAKCLESSNNFCCWQETNLFDEAGKLSYRYSCVEFEAAKKKIIGDRDEKVFLQVIGSEENEITVDNICAINEYYISKFPSIGPNLQIQQRACQCRKPDNGTKSSNDTDSGDIEKKA
jgi:hypothetical protein